MFTQEEKTLMEESLARGKRSIPTFLSAASTIAGQFSCILKTHLRVDSYTAEGGTQGF